jgi:outer membrane protein assembly factor BamE (lipoprotein component of BamABCDE complex)
MLAGLVLAGCATPTQRAGAPTPTASALAALQKGQTGAQVKAMLGEPASTRPFSASVAGLAVEEWVYRHARHSRR